MSAKPRVLITNIPFAHLDPRPRETLDEAGVEVVLNPLGRALKEDEYADLIEGFDILLAGTEPVTAKVMDAAPGLKLIARIGIGLDNVGLAAARARDIPVTHTPDGPSPAAAELTIALMLNALRQVSRADRSARNGEWNRFTGRRLATCTVGVIGVGRIGKRVIRHLVGGFPGVRILGNDLEPDEAFGREFGVEWTDKETIYRTSDVVSLHVPLTPLTSNMTTRRELGMMRGDACLVNMARGGIVHEADLATALREERIAGAASDVFAVEPYAGELAAIDTFTMTCHMGANSPDCRLAMEMGAVGEVLRLLKGEPFAYPAPEAEYERALAANA